MLKRLVCQEFLKMELRSETWYTYEDL